MIAPAGHKILHLRTGFELLVSNYSAIVGAHQAVVDAGKNKRNSEMGTDNEQRSADSADSNEAIVRRAYHTAEGSVLDVQGFTGLFTEHGVINLGNAGQELNGAGQDSYRGEHLGELVLNIAKLYPDIHRELHRVNVLGDMVAVELSIQGTFLGPLETPDGTVQPTGVKVDVPTADFWYLRDGKIERFDCYVMVSTILAQLGILPDFASAVGAQAP